MKPNRYLPFDNFKIISQLPLSEVQLRLARSIQEKRQLFSFTPHANTRPYEGVMNDNIFKISRIIDYRNSFLPVITGEISTQLDKTEIVVRMRPAIAVLAFLAVWFLFTGLACIAVILVLIGIFRKTSQQEIDPLFIIPFALFAFGYILVMFGYKREANKSKKFLLDLVKGNEI